MAQHFPVVLVMHTQKNMLFCCKRDYVQAFISGVSLGTKGALTASHVGSIPSDCRLPRRRALLLRPINQSAYVESIQQPSRVGHVNPEFDRSLSIMDTSRRASVGRNHYADAQSSASSSRRRQCLQGDIVLGRTIVPGELIQEHERDPHQRHHRRKLAKAIVIVLRVAAVWF